MSKLVRDKIPDIVMESGLTIQVRRAVDDREYLHYLRAKLNEEVHEFQEVFGTASFNMEEAIEELADIAEVICTLANTLMVNGSEIMRKTRITKAHKRGGFEMRYIITDLNEGIKLDD